MASPATLPSSFATGASTGAPNKRPAIPTPSASSSSAPGSSNHSSRLTAKSTTDPILRNALRYTISAREYEALHKAVFARSRVLRKSTPSPARVERLVSGSSSSSSGSGGARDDYNAAAVRAALRVFIGSAAGLKLWDVVKAKLVGKGRQVGPKTSTWKSPNFRLSLSLSTILLLHRLLYRFFTRLRAQLLAPDARPFRERNPRTSKTLTSSLAPAVGASLAGLMLGAYPSDQFRLTLTIYLLSRAAEFSYNHAENEGWIWGKEGSRWERPWWWGSWLLMPPVFGQLLHAFVFDRDCFPKAYGDFILRFSPQYIQTRPEDYPSNLPWPDNYEIVDNLSRMAKRNWPPFVSPILFPDYTLPEAFASSKPITSMAQPTINSLSCALLHPHDPSCLRTYFKYWLEVYPKLVKVFSVIFGVLSITKWRSFYKAPITSLDKLARSVLRMSAFFAGAVGTSWASICFFQHFLPGRTLPTQRMFLGGFMGGLWAYLERDAGRSNFLYSARMSADSLWKVGIKRGWWKAINGGDVWLCVASLAAINVIYERDPAAITSGVIRRVVSGLRGDGFGDVVKKDQGKLTGRVGTDGR